MGGDRTWDCKPSCTARSFAVIRDLNPVDILPAGIENATDLLYYNQGFADGESDAKTVLTPGDRRYFQGATAFHEEHLATWLRDRWAALPDRDKATVYTRGWLAAVSRP